MNTTAQSAKRSSLSKGLYLKLVDMINAQMIMSLCKENMIFPYLLKVQDFTQQIRNDRTENKCHTILQINTQTARAGQQ